MSMYPSHKVQRLLLSLLAVLLLAATVALIVQNWHTGVSVQWFSWTEQSISLGSLMGLASLMLGGAMLLMMWVRLLSLGQAYQKTSRELERQDVSREEAVEKVKVLESKIQTLETALSQALKLSH